MLVIGREHTDANLKKYNEKKGFSFPLYPDKNRAIFNAFAKNLIPRSYLIGKDGKVIYTSKGQRTIYRLATTISNTVLLGLINMKMVHSSI